jgi:hypothetical protein
MRLGIQPPFRRIFFEFPAGMVVWWRGPLTAGLLGMQAIKKKKGIRNQQLTKWCGGKGL